jgi:tRNA modification GTPase
MDLGLLKAPQRENDVRASAKTGEGMDGLKAELERLAFGSDSGGAALALTSRHVRAIQDAMESIARAGMHTGSLELVAADFRAGLDSLGGILGVVTPDDVLGRIFSTFCIGK